MNRFFKSLSRAVSDIHFGFFFGLFFGYVNCACFAVYFLDGMDGGIVFSPAAVSFFTSFIDYFIDFTAYYFLLLLFVLLLREIVFFFFPPVYQEEEEFDVYAASILVEEQK